VSELEIELAVLWSRIREGIDFKFGRRFKFFIAVRVYNARLPRADMSNPN
jgi:hypothetical protein